MTKHSTHRQYLPLLYVGLIVTALVALAPLVDLVTMDSIGNHVREAYPQWPRESVDADRTAIVIYLGAVGILGIAGWFWTIRMFARRAKWTCAVGTLMFGLGTLIALTNLTYGGEAYQTIIPIGYGLLGFLPVVVGAVALLQLWRQPGSAPLMRSSVTN